MADTRVSITVDTGSAESGINRLRTAFQTLDAATNTASRDLDSAGRATQNAGNRASSTATAITGLSRASTTANTTMSSLHGSTFTFVGNTTRATTATNSLTGALATTATGASRTHTAMSSLASSTTTTASSVNNISTATATASSGLSLTARTANSTASSMGGVSSASSSASTGLSTTASSASRLHNALNGLRTLSVAAAVGFGALALGVKGAVDEAIKFESAMADVKKVVNFDSPDGLKNMRQDLLDLSTQIPITADGLAKIAAAAGQSGIAANEITKFTESAAKMGTAFDISAEEAGQAMAEMRTAFKMSQTDVEALADKINYLGNTSPNNAAKIMKIVQIVGPLGELAGVTSGQIAAMGASVNSLAPEVVSTGLKNMFLALTKGESATKSANYAFKKLGMDSVQVSKDMQVNSEATINRIIEALKKLPEAERTATINDLFGAEALPVIAQMVTNTETLAKNLQAVGDASKYAGSMQAEYAARSATTENQMALLGNNLNVLKINIGSALLPAINSIAQAIIPVVQSMATWAQQNPETVQTIVMITGAVLGVIAVLGGLALVVTAVTAGWGALVAIGGGIAAVFGAISLPVLAVVAAIGALITAGVYLYQNWDTVKAKAQEVWETIGGTVAMAVDNITAKWESLKQGTSDIWQGAINATSNGMTSISESVANGWQGIQNFFSKWSDEAEYYMDMAWQAVTATTQNAWENIKSAVSNGVESVKSAFSNAFNGLREIASNVWNSVKSIISSGWSAIQAIFSAGLSVISSIFNAQFSAIKAIVTTTLNVIKALAQGDMQAVKSAFVNGFNQIVSAVKTMGSNILGAFRTLGSQMVAIGGDIINGLINGIKAKAGAVVAEAQAIAGRISSTIKSALDIHSPSRVTTALGEHAGQGLANGLKNKKDEVAKQAEQLAKQVMDNIASIKKEVAVMQDGSTLADINYDVKVGKYAGVSPKLIDELKNVTLLKAEYMQTKKELDAFKQAQEGVNNSIADTSKQVALIGKDNPLSSLLYDIINTQKYAGVSEDSLNTLIAKYRELNAAQKGQEADKAFTDLQTGMVQETPAQRMTREYQEKLAVIDTYEQLHTDKTAEAAALRASVNAQYTQSSQNMMLDSYQTLFGGLADLTQSFAGKQSGIYKGMFVMQRAFAIAQAGLNMWKAGSSAYADTPGTVWQKLGAAAIAVAKGGQFVSLINAIKPPAIGQAHDGIMSVPKSGTWNLEKGERVLPSKTAAAMDKKLENSSNSNIQVNNYSSAKVETRQENGLTIFDVKNVVDEHMRSQMSNPNSTVSKSIYRNTNARPQR